jgi:hypothetical protein
MTWPIWLTAPPTPTHWKRRNRIIVTLAYYAACTAAGVALGTWVIRP